MLSVFSVDFLICMKKILLLLPFLFSFQESSNYVKLLGKCGSEIKWLSKLDDAYEQAKEQKRLILWYVPRIKGKHMDNPVPLNYYMLSGPFTNEEIVTIISRKFIPVKMDAKGELGVRANEYMEPSIIFVSPDKKIVHKINTIRTFNDDFFYNQMLLVLEKNKEYNEPSKDAEKAKKLPDSDVKNLISLAKEYIYDGEIKKGEEILDKLLGQNWKTSDESYININYELARISRILRKSDDALKYIKTAKGNSKAEDISNGLATTEEGLLLLKVGKFNEAKECFTKIVKEYKECSRLPEAKYYLGVISLLANDEKTAKETWKSIAKDYPDSRWAWKAAANLIQSKKVAGHDDITYGVSAITHCLEEVTWLNEAHYINLCEGTVWKREEKDLDNVTELAIKFLLKSQRSTGAWDDARYVFAGSHTLPNVNVAISALCATALLECGSKDQEAINTALSKAITYLSNEKNMARGKSARAKQSSEEIYADCYRLLFFTRLLSWEKCDKRHAKEMISDLLKQIESQQVKGFWSHEYPNPFTTAALVHALQIAKDAGIDVPKKLFEKAATALKSTRNTKGTFGYGSGEQGDNVKGSAGRMPMCEMALYFAGESDLDQVAKALEAFVKNINYLLMVRKSDNHADSYRNAGFFFFHDFYPATEAAKLLKEDKKKEYKKKLLEILLSISEIDGAFIDSHEMGRSFGTAMALLSLKNCQSK